MRLRKTIVWPWTLIKVRKENSYDVQNHKK